MLVRGAVVAFGQRRPLAWLALARRCAAASHAAVERAGLALLLDEGHRGGDSFVHGPGHLGLHRDREVAPDVLEQGLVRFGEIEGVSRKPLHRLLAVSENSAAIFEALHLRNVRIDQILDRPVDGSRVLVHAVTKMAYALVGQESYPFLVSGQKRLLQRGKPGAEGGCERAYRNRPPVTKSASSLSLVPTGFWRTPAGYPVHQLATPLAVTA